MGGVIAQVKVPDFFHCWVNFVTYVYI
jgi:hypothetical protein